ncbi:hypothetical protein ACFFNA_39515, partial [Mesorhizobium kowhaii]|uniref:hypothetical protein n=1 Tax=Mesorhizobium kowhaii TaxID=1300272 RepID=UPI0035F028AB
WLFQQTTFYHQLEAQRLCTQSPGMGSSRIPHLSQTEWQPMSRMKRSDFRRSIPCSKAVILIDP